jgi:Transcription factor WhiB
MTDRFLPDTAWRNHAACAGTDPNDWVWIPGHKHKDARKAAKLKEICATCPVSRQCLEAELDAMRNGEGSYGVFGGTDVNERRAMLGKGRSNHNPTPITHGSMAGYVKHNRYPHIFAEPCQECRDAYNERRNQLKQEQRARRIRAGVADWVQRDHPLHVVEGGAA